MDGRPAAASPLNIRVRRAAVADTEAVMRFTQATWDGWDYVSDVWASWLDARDGVVLAAETELEPGRPIAIGRAAMLSSNESWMEGLRVDPDVRGRGVAIAFQLAQLAWSQAQGTSVVRYATGETNEASLHLGAKHGFVEAGRWRALRPEAIGDSRGAAATDAQQRDARQLGIVERSRAGAGLSRVDPPVRTVWERLRRDPTFRSGGELYEWRAWAWQQLDEGRLGRHIERGELLEATDGDRWALGLVAGERLRGETRVSLLGGDPGPARRIVDAVTAAAGRRPVVRLPDGSPLLAELGPTMAADGWRMGAHVLVLMARPLRDPGGGPLPLPEEGGDRLTFIEEPHRLGLAPRD